SGRAGPQSAWAWRILHQSMGPTCRWNVARASRPRHPRIGLELRPRGCHGRSVHPRPRLARRPSLCDAPGGRDHRRGYAAVSKFDLRDISQRLSESRDTEALILEFLSYLESVRPDWRASLVFYEVSQDALVSVYQRASKRLTRKDLRLPVDQLPA